jgi:hypothetical protein
VIEGKVAAILNERQLVINRGTDHGVVEDMEFGVFESHATTVTDPDDDQSLGEVHAEKIRVQIISVQAKFSVGQTFETYGGRVGIYDYMDIYKTVPPKVRTLKTSDAIYRPLAEGESYVRRGDLVREIEAEGS